MNNGRLLVLIHIRMASQARFFRTYVTGGGGGEVKFTHASGHRVTISPQNAEALHKFIELLEAYNWREASVEIKCADDSIVFGLDPYATVDCPDIIMFIVNGETWDLTADGAYHWILNTLRTLVVQIDEMSLGASFKEKSELRLPSVRLSGLGSCLRVFPRSGNIVYEIGIEGVKALLSGFYSVKDLCEEKYQRIRTHGATICSVAVKNSFIVKSLTIYTGFRRRMYHVIIMYNDNTARGFDMSYEDVLEMFDYMTQHGYGGIEAGQDSKQVRELLQKSYHKHPFVPKPDPKQVSTGTPANASVLFVKELDTTIRTIVREELSNMLQTMKLDEKR